MKTSEKVRERHKRMRAFYRIAQKAWESRNKERLNQEARIRVAAWKAKNRDRVRLQVQNRKNRAAGQLSKDILKKLRILQRGLCVACGSRPEAFHLDHIFPIALGGKNEDANVQLLCPTCNLSKGSKHPVAFMQSIGKLL